MTNPFPALFLALLTATCPLALAGDLDGAWLLEVRDPKAQKQVEAKVRFSDQPAKSCMGGTWKAVIIDSVAKEAGNFFPITSPLAYTIREGILTLGRAEICDGYMFLSGVIQPQNIKGEYSAVSIGGARQLGTFTLRRSP